MSAKAPISREFRRSASAGKSRQRQKPTRPISLRLSDEERVRLVADAGRRSVSAYIRMQLFGSEARKRAIRVPVAGDIQIARILAELGRAELAANLHDLAEAVRIGALPVTPETEHAIRSACEAVERMRADLLHALGLRRGTYE